MRCTFFKNQHQLIIVFCILAAIRVFIYLSFFPFFSNVDEAEHFDLVMKYSNGHVSRSFENISPVSAKYIIRYGSAEYYTNPVNLPQHKFPPPMWKFSDDEVKSYFDPNVAIMSSVTNHESSQPPLYYTIAGIWMKLGSLFGIQGGWFLYWIRFLNIFLVIALVWTAYIAAKKVFPESRFIVLGVPLLAALLPQDAYYSIQSDVLSPLCFGLAFVSVISFLRSESLNLLQCALAGLAIAATTLIKSCNLPLLVLVIVILLFKVYQLSHKRKLKPAIAPIGLFAFCALMPVFIWFAWNLSTFGDLTASESEMHLLRWSHKPFFDWFHHPIFTPQGAWVFWSIMMETFWRGEFVWSSIPLALPIADYFYCISSLIFIALALINTHKLSNELQRKINWFAFWSFVSLVMFLVFISVSFDFGTGINPSREHPYFSSGRLITAALIPFLLLYVQGLNYFFSWIKNENVRFGILITIGLFITVSEIIVNWPAFSSQYNLFHM